MEGINLLKLFSEPTPFSLSLRGIDSYAQNHISHMVLKCKEQLLLFKSKHARAKRSKSNLDDFTTFPTFLYRHCKISILVENDIYNFSSFLLKCVSHPFENADLIFSGSFFTVSISDNHRFVCFFPGVPSNPRTSLDYMKGLFEGEIEDSSEVTTKSLSPSMLKKRMEHQQTLQSSSGQMRRYEFTNFQISFTPCFSAS